MSPLTAEDRARLSSTVQQQIHGKSPGTVATWSNPGGHSGTIKLLSKTVRQGMPCEQIEYQTMEPGTAQVHSRYVFTSCRLPDGTWKLAD
jgi:surface antigen